MADEGQKILVNLGCGHSGAERLPPALQSWRHIRVDVDPLVRPDVLANLTDLSAFRSGSVHAVWAAHCVEHLFQHEVPKALSEIQRILAPGGFACILVPDLQKVAEFIAADRLHETLYQSAAGPITAHDIVFGFGADIARGNVFMAHRCGFTPAVMLRSLAGADFAESVLLRRSNLELAAIGCKTPWASAEARDALINQLGL